MEIELSIKRKSKIVGFDLTRKKREVPRLNTDPSDDIESFAGKSSSICEKSRKKLKLLKTTFPILVSISNKSFLGKILEKDSSSVILLGPANQFG